MELESLQHLINQGSAEIEIDQGVQKYFTVTNPEISKDISISEDFRKKSHDYLINLFLFNFLNKFLIFFIRIKRNWHSMIQTIIAHILHNFTTCRREKATVFVCRSTNIQATTFWTCFDFHIEPLEYIILNLTFLEVFNS